MECNKDEAARAKEISEKKFAAKDIWGAKKFALKAQKLYPRLDGLHQMLATLDVYLSAENKIGGESDWYGILGVSPDADDDSIRRHYRKMALILHPDKNKSIGADGAFKILSEAWNLLSDKTRRTAYDYRRKLDTSIQQRVLTASRGPSASPRGPNAPFPAPAYVPSPTSSLCTSKPKTFWAKFTRLFTRKSKTTTDVDNDDTGRSRWLIIKGGVAMFQFWKDKLDNFQSTSNTH